MAEDAVAAASDEKEKPNPWANITLLQPDTLRHQYLIPPQSIEYHESQDRTPAWERHCYEQFGLDIPRSGGDGAKKCPNTAAINNVRYQIESLCKDVDWLQHMVWQAVLEECYEAWASDAATTSGAPRIASQQIVQRIQNGIAACMNGHRPSRGVVDVERREVLSGGRVADWLAAQTQAVQDTTNPYVWATPGAIRDYLFRKRPTNADVQAQLHELAEQTALPELALTTLDRAMLAQLLPSDAAEAADYHIVVCDRNTFQLALASTPDPQQEADAAKWASQRASQIANASWTEPPSQHWLVQAKAHLPGPAAIVKAVEAEIPAELVPTRRGRGRTIYYGNTTDSSSTSPKQLQEAVLRWITEQQGPASLPQCAEQLEVPSARMRTALGKVVWQRRQLVERTVELLTAPAAAVPAVVEPNESEETQYARSVYATEQALRHLVVQQLTMACSPHKLALAGDDALATEEDYTGAEWLETGHEWIQLEIMRPVIVEEESILMRYEITAYTAARLSEDDGAMERRPRFRAVPPEGPALLLTEAQVWAGRHALLANDKLNAAASSSRTLVQSMRLHSNVANVEAQVLGHDVVGTTGEQKFLLLLRGESTATWATLRGSQCVLDDGSEYQVRLSDYDADSAAYQECVSILKYIQRQPKGKPFLFPVDPVALGIPQYAEVVQHPMDVSTVFSKLERGEYSNPPSVDNNPVTSMLQGPFRADIELIFDNAMLFNPPDDWIHHAAAGLKKSTLHKIEQTCRNCAIDSGNSRSMYVDDEFSDDEHGGSRKRKRRGGGSSSTSDLSAAAIAEPVRLDILQSRLPISSNADQFGWASSRWLCRSKSHSELDELKALYQLQRQEQRSRRRAKQDDNTSTNLDLEYYTRGDTTTLTCTNRRQAEIKQEQYHERMAKLYGTTTTVPVYPACLPPYLGRVLDGKWEIRSERVTDALRWVVRGLAHTEHVVWDTDDDWVTPNSLYYADPVQYPAFGTLDARKAKKAAAAQSDSDEEDVALSEYEKARLERVARNNEKLKMLGLT